MYVLDVDKEEWTTGPDLPFPRSDLCGAFVDGRVYAVGGYSLRFQSTLDTVTELDLSTNEWKSVKSMPTPRGDCKATQLDGKLLVIGGYYDQTDQWSPDSFRSEVELFSPVRPSASITYFRFELYRNVGYKYMDRAFTNEESSWRQVSCASSRE